MRGRLVAAVVLLSLSCVPGTQARPLEPTEGEPRVAVDRSVSRLLTDPAELQPSSSVGALQEPAMTAAALDALSDEKLRRCIRDDLASLGPMSLGRPNAGALINGVPMPEGEHWEIVSPRTAWGTQETIDALVLAIEQVNAQYPDTHVAYIGDISRELGGPLRPHRSHQSGRDVDVSYYYHPDRAAWYQRASARTLDVERTWALVRALLTETDVEMMFIDLSVQKLLKEHALAVGEDPAWLDSVFQYGARRAGRIIRHTWGHASHIHVRFYNPVAQRLGVRSYEQLAELELITPLHRYVRYQARGGDTVEAVAVRAGTTPRALRSMNGLRTGNLVAGRTYLVPLRGRVAKVREVTIPPRRLPPATLLAGGATVASAAP